MAATKKILTLKKSKETSGTVVYANADQGIGGLYFPKMMFEGDRPSEITVTVEWK